MSERDECGGIGYDDAGAFEPDEGDEQSDADADCVFEIARDAIDDGLSNAADCQDQKQNAGKKYGAERNRPVQSENAANVISKEGVEPHAGSERDGIIGKDAHQQRGERGDPNG